MKLLRTDYIDTLHMGLLTGAREAFDRAASYEDNFPTAGRARRIWDWCLERDLNIRHMALRFCLEAPIDGIVMPGPCNK